MPLLGLEKVSFELTKGIKQRVNEDLKGIYLSGLGNIISGTQADKGLHRNSWLLTVGAPSGAVTTNENKAGSDSFVQLANMPISVLGKKIYFTSNAPAMNILEYGGFPSPVDKGSYIKESGSYQKLSANGFSKQAPNGWVRKTIIAMGNKVRSI